MHKALEIYFWNWNSLIRCEDHKRLLFLIFSFPVLFFFNYYYAGTTYFFRARRSQPPQVGKCPYAYANYSFFFSLNWAHSKWDVSRTPRRTGGDNSNKRCFGTNPKLFRESGDFAGNRDTWEFFRETRDNSGTLPKKSGHRRSTIAWQLELGSRSYVLVRGARSTVQNHWT